MSSVTTTLHLPASLRPVSINETRGKHWAVQRAVTQPWRDAAYVVGRNHLTLSRMRGEPYVTTPAVVRIVLTFRRGGRRDPHNYVGTVVKAAVDGLTAAGLWPDDTPDWVEVAEPHLVVTEQPHPHGIILTPRTENPT